MKSNGTDYEPESLRFDDSMLRQTLKGTLGNLYYPEG